jgi:hypothetical protein
MIKKLPALLLCLIIFGLFCLLAPAVSAGIENIDFGVTKTASIDLPGEVDTYAFIGNTGDGIEISVTKIKGDLIPRVTLVGSNGKEIKRTTGSTNSEIVYILTAPGTYKILIDDGFQGKNTGAYSLFVQTTSSDQSNAVTGGNPVPASVTTVPTPVVRPTPRIPKTPADNTSPGEFPMDYLLLVIIAIVMICAAFLAYFKFVKKIQSPDSAGPTIRVPSAYQGRVSGTIDHDVIVSYSTPDKPKADAVCAGLEARGIRCWIAPRDILPGINYQEGIVDAITSSKIMVLIYSSHANESPHVIREATIAMSKKVIIIPFRTDDSPPSKTMEFITSVPHWLDAIDPPLEKHIEELANTVMILLKNEKKK